MNTVSSALDKEMPLEINSRFVGSPAAFYFINLFFLAVSVLSVSILYPAAYFLSEKWKIENTYIDGKKLAFNGRLTSAYAIYFTGLFFAAASLFLINYLVRLLPFDLPFLSAALNGATAGLNALFVTNRLRRWKMKNTHYDGIPTGLSQPERNLIKSACVSLLSAVVSVVTLGISYPLVYKIKESYYTDMSVIDGDDVFLDGKAAPPFPKWFLGLFLSVITLGLFIPMLGYFLYKWKAENLHSKYITE